MDVKLIQKVKATKDKGSLDLTRQIDESELALNTLKKIIENLQNENKAYKEEIGKRLDEIKKVKTENNSYKVIIGAQTEVMRKAIQEIELRQAEALYFKQKYEAAVSKLSI